MKVLLILKDIIVVILTLLLFLCTISAYIKLRPPQSVILVFFRMLLQITLKLQLILLPVIFFSYSLYYFVIFKDKTPHIITLICLIALLCCFILNSFSLRNITNAVTKKDGIEYSVINAGNEKQKYKLSLQKDFAKETEVSQFELHSDESSPYKRVAIVYMNFGGWTAQDKSMGGQMYNFCEKEGYTFIRFACDRKVGEKIDTIVQKSNYALEKILTNEKFDKVFLAGGSAGGHLALLCANKETGDKDFSVNQIKIDGVIALYPCVNPEYMYDYYVINNSDNTSLSARLGNLIYCTLFQGNSGTMAGETELLYEQVFGEKNDENSLYEKTNIINCIGTKDIPILIVQGEADSMIAVQSVRNFYDAMVLKGKTISYLELPGVEHVFDMMATPAWSRCEKEMTGYIRELIK